jgi:hypothetical protein
MKIERAPELEERRTEVRRFTERELELPAQVARVVRKARKAPWQFLIANG